MVLNANLKVTYNSSNISADLKKYLLRYSFTDYASGKADDLQLTLEDKKGLWQSSWLPSKGATLQAWLTNQDNLTLPFGTFYVDEVEPEGPPNKVTIKGVSVPTSSSLWDEEKSQAWEETLLSVIADEIAMNADLGLFYDTDYDPEFDRIEQNNETDIIFLMRICDNAGLSLKVSGGKVVIFDSSKYENMAAVMTIYKEKSGVTRYSGRSTTRGIYSAARVEYEGTGEAIDYTYVPPNKPDTGRTLVITERVASIAEAETLAKNRLRLANMQENTFSITMAGNVRLVAGVTVYISGWGSFDGKYFVNEAHHSGGASGYTTRVELQKVLVGY